MTHPELAAEQAYVDHAYECLERMRDVVVRAADAADGEVAQAALDAWAARRLATYEDAERGLCFGRLDFETLERPLYVGRRWVHDEGGDRLVVNWQAPAARPFYTATPIDPQGVTLRRRFRANGRTLLDIADETLDGTTLDGARVSDFLLEELERSRDERMRDIVATIQADQYRLITHPPDSPLVIQGGPGTGKTAVGLHRASWLLYTARERSARSRVLVVGPNRTFMEYVSHVLPALGEDAVEQRAVSELVDGVEPTLNEPGDVVRLKGDDRMAEVIGRAAEIRLRGEPDELLLRLDGAFVRVRVRDQVRLARRGARGARHDGRRARALPDGARPELLRRVRPPPRGRRDARRGAGRAGAPVERRAPARPRSRVAGGRAGAGSSGRSSRRPPSWPRPPRASSRTPPSSGSCAAAARGWGDADVALLDEAHALVGEPRAPFDHVIVDEAQDLSPMQLRMIARRAKGMGLTMLGDIAQGTGSRAYETLGRGGRPPARRRRCGNRGAASRVPGAPRDHGARPPAARHDRAADRAAARLPGRDVRAGRPPGRRGRAPPRGVPRRGRARGARRGSSPLIVPDELVEPALAEPSAFEGIPLLTPREAKGLEFDHVIVVEPALVADRHQGLRELYVALTRPTRTLVVLHARPLPPRAGPRLD